jgi:hypothetical protein
VIVHYHIFKNGGSTLETILQRQFGTRFARLHGATPESTLDFEDLADFLIERREIAAVSSHHLRYPKFAIRRMALFDCCFLRHPLTRLHSVYTYLRGINSSDSLCLHAHEQTPREFMQWLLDRFPNIVSNIQVTQLGNAGLFTRPANEADLARAIAVLQDMAIPGLVERFDESLVAAEYFLNPAFPDISLEYAPQNISPRGISFQPGISTSDDRQALLRELWGDDIYQELAHLNQLDLALFQRAEDEVLRRFDLVPGREARLLDFNRRCLALRAAVASPSEAPANATPVAVEQASSRSQPLDAARFALNAGAK